MKRLLQRPFTSPVNFVIRFGDEEERPREAVVREGEDAQTLLIFSSDDPVKGEVEVYLQPGKRIEHAGIKVEMVGKIDLFRDRGSQYEFTSIVRELDGPGKLTENKTYQFDFSHVTKEFESYTGTNVVLRYILRVTILRPYNFDLTADQEFLVYNTTLPPKINKPIKMEVGIEESLHIEFEYAKSKYSLQDVIIGKIYFLLVKIQIKHMEMAILKRESCGTGSNIHTETQTVTKYEIMDGAPVRGESVPIRVFLGGFGMTPTYENVNNKFSVRYYVNLLLVDVEDRRYFKQHEIVMYRKELPALVPPS